MIFQAYEIANGDLGEQEQAFLDEIFEYVTDYGEMDEFFDDPDVSKIMVNGPNQVFIEKHGKLLLTPARYENDMQLRFAANHIINPFGRYVNYRTPTVDAHLKDGSRVNIVIPPVAQQGTCISIRLFLKDKLSVQDLIAKDSITQAMADFAAVCVQARLNVVVAGNTSSGKTTFLNILARSIPDHERIVTIEDSVELNLSQTHKVSLEARPARALTAAGSLAYYEGDIPSSEQSRKEALTIFRNLGDRIGIADCLIGLGNTAISQGNYDTSRQFYEESLMIRKELGDKWGVARLLGNLGLLTYFQTDYIQSQSLHSESLTLFRELQDDEGVVNELVNLGDVYYCQKDFSTANALYKDKRCNRQEFKR